MMKSVLFDLDGTLLDTLEDLYLSVNAALEMFGFPEKTKDEVRQSVGNGVRNLMIRSVPDGEANPRFEECSQAFQKYYQKHLNDHTGPYAGIMELLRELSAMRCPMAVISNKGDLAVKKLCQQYFEGVIPVAIGETATVRRKPEPDTVFEAIRSLGVQKEDCVYIGDSEVDLLTSANSGIPCICVSWGFRGRKVLTDLGASCIVDTPEELLTVLKDWVSGKKYFKIHHSCSRGGVMK